MSIKLGLLASSQQQAAPLLLDVYPGASAAYSLRKLRTAYTGNCIRVRRSDNGSETNIGFVNNVLDTATMQTFIGSATGFVITWYDQSGNGNNAITTAINTSPEIIQSGVLVTDGGKVAIQAGTQWMDMSGITANTSYSGFSVISRTLSNNFMMSFASTFIPVISLAYSDGNLYNANGVQTTYYSFTSTGRFLFTTLNISNSQNAYKNSVLQTVTSILQIGGNVFNRILGRSNTERTNGKTQEHIFYNTNQSSNRSGIETNINTFYSIY